MSILIPDFRKAHVLVVGDVMLDRYWYGTTSRISPEAPVPVVMVGESEERPGGAGNVALNVVSLGGRADLMGLIGDDDAGSALVRSLENAGVGCHFEIAPELGTVSKLRIISRQQQMIRLDFEGGFHRVDGGPLTARFEALLPACAAVVLSDYGKGTLSQTERLIDLANTAGKRVLVDPKGSDFTRYRGATIITPNLEEFTAVAGHCRTEEELLAKAGSLREELRLDAILITRGERGMTLVRSGEPALDFPTRAREVFDVTGAGDTVIASLAAGLAAGLDVAEATALSNLAAGVVVGKLGTASATVGELRRAQSHQEGVQRGVVDAEGLVTLVGDARMAGEKVVMTNGCFDILHAGHVAYLEEARQLGDRLVVAVNDDASVRRLKGPERPVNTLEQRMAVLRSLVCVDWVVPFSEDTPERLIGSVGPDVLVKGGDYRPEEIAGGEHVLAAGGEVIVLDYVEGLSTSRIIGRIRSP